jgi:hypothetical protein
MKQCAQFSFGIFLENLDFSAPALSTPFRSNPASQSGRLDRIQGRGKKMKKLPIVWLMIAIGLSFGVLAAPSQVEFVAPVISISEQTENSAVLEMAVTPSASVIVLVNEFTEIKDGDTILSPTDLEVGMTLKVEGFFGDSGIVAKELLVTEGTAPIELRGEIAAIDEATQMIVVVGFELLVTNETKIRDAENVGLDFSDLEVGQFVRVEADVDGDNIVALSILIGAGFPATARIMVEGVVVELNGLESLLLQVEGLSDPIHVLLTDTTHIIGSLALGVFARVIGRLTPELMVEADRIIVLSGLRLAPSRVRMPVDSERRIQVILRNILEEPLLLTIESSDPSVVEPETDSMEIPAGVFTTSFRIFSGSNPGNAVITVETASGLLASVSVQVFEPGSQGPGAGPSLLPHWAPPQLNLLANQTLGAQIVLKGPASEEIVVALELVEGEPGLVDFPPTVTFLPGQAVARVDVTAGPDAGNGRIEATFPNGDSAGLAVTVRLLPAAGGGPPN